MPLSTIEEWQEASDTLARERAGRTPDKFPYALGIDHPDAMKDWLALDAADTLLTLLPTQAMVFVNQGMDEASRSRTRSRRRWRRTRRWGWSSGCGWRRRNG
jgi:hypothetical protein